MTLVRLVLAALAAVAAAVAGIGTTSAPSSSPSAASSPSSSPSSPSSSTSSASPSSGPLRGIVIAIDPGHQLGNGRFPGRINALVTAGTDGFRKPCNTTGTSTDAGYTEASFNFAVASDLRRRLTALGATVRMTRTTNSASRWGPCVDARGRFGAAVHARLLVSIHGDGAPPAGHGFFVIAPARARMFHPAIQERSVRLAQDLRSGMLGHGFTPSTYVRGGYYTRSDLATLNLSGVPIALIELGNMRNPADARTMSSSSGRASYAAGLVSGIRRFLHD